MGFEPAAPVITHRCSSVSLFSSCSVYEPAVRHVNRTAAQWLPHFDRTLLGNWLPRSRQTLNQSITITRLHSPINTLTKLQNGLGTFMIKLNSPSFSSCMFLPLRPWIARCSSNRGDNRRATPRVWFTREGRRSHDATPLCIHKSSCRQQASGNASARWSRVLTISRPARKSGIWNTARYDTVIAFCSAGDERLIRHRRLICGVLKDDVISLRCTAPVPWQAAVQPVTNGRSHPHSEHLAEACRHPRARVETDCEEPLRDT
jgi:hypothetical protein